MLVKHNLCPFYDLAKSNPQFFSSSGESISTIDGMITAEPMKSNMSIFNPKQSQALNNQNITLSMIIENLGKNHVTISTNRYNKFITLYPGDKKECTFNGIGNDYIEIAVYMGGQTKLKAYNSRVNLGKELSDVYLPNINTLPTDKQALLPPEGNYKEIQAM